jgi:hypothetical protein
VGESGARPVQQTKHMLIALARKPYATMELDMHARRFPPPWSVKKLTPQRKISARARLV